MIFVGGIHGVGKTTFCNKVKNVLDIETYSASTLIEQEKNISFSKDKLATNINDNQDYLLNAIRKMDCDRKTFILDGHFCLLNKNGAVTRVDVNTFIKLRPIAIIVLTDNPSEIALRRKERDGVNQNANEIELFQNEEIKYAKEVTELLETKLFVSTGESDFIKTVDFIREVLGG